MIVNNGPPAPGYVDQQGDFHYYDPHASGLGTMTQEAKKKLTAGVLIMVVTGMAAFGLWLAVKTLDDEDESRAFWDNYAKRYGRRR